MWSTLVLLSLTTAGLVAADCDEDACNIGISAGVGAAGVCSVVGGIFCGVTFGLGCAVSAGCGIAGAVAGAGQSACGLCGEGGGGISGEQLRGLIGEVLEAENGTQGLIGQVLGNQQETQDLIRRSTQKIMDGFKEVNRNIEELANQMNSVKIDLSRLIKTGVLQVSYLKDLEHFDLFSQRFEDMERDSSGLIVKNRKVEEFKRVVNDDFKGAERTYKHFHTMAVGGGLFGQMSIYEIDSTYCSSKDYILYVMIRLFEFDATAKAMDGRALDPDKIERFKQMYINVEQKHIQTCGCPPDGPAQQMRNLQQLVSQPSPRTSAAEFYDSVILNELVSHTNLKKLHLLYKAKPFDFNWSILSAIKSQPIEVPELVFNLAKHGNLNTLPLLEDKLICTKGTTTPTPTPTPLGSPTHACYSWSNEDLAAIKAAGSERSVCESLGHVFSKGDENKAPGCGTCWCCQKTG